MAGLGDIFSGKSSLKDYIGGKLKSLAGYSEQEVGIGAWTLFARVSDTVNMQADVPTVTLEDGTVAADCIINRPIVVDIRGDVSDIFIKRDPTDTIQESALGQLSNISKYLPGRTQSQLSKVNGFVNDVRDTVNKIDSVIADGRQFLDLFGKDEPPAAGYRQQFLEYIRGVREAKQLISVQMPFTLYDNMAIVSFVTDSDNLAEVIHFRITLQQMTFASLEFVGLAADLYPKPAPEVAPVTGAATNKGTQAPSTSSNASALYNLAHKVGGGF